MELTAGRTRLGSRTVGRAFRELESKLRLRYQTAKNQEETIYADLFSTNQVRRTHEKCFDSTILSTDNMARKDDN